jgi:hypothetical protein
LAVTQKIDQRLARNSRQHGQVTVEDSNEGLVPDLSQLVIPLELNGTEKMVALANSPASISEFSTPARGLDLELTHRIDAKTFRQVRDLHVVRNEDRIVLRGHSQSYYVKQLATHAVLNMFPGLVIENAIAVRR